MGDGGVVKSVCASMLKYSNHVWRSVFYRIDEDLKESEIKFPSDPGMANLSFYGHTICKGKVYFVGGQDEITKALSCKAFCFDLSTNKWEKIEDMQVARAFPIVVPVANVIFVFGTKLDPNIHANQWAEVYHLKSKSWSYLPKDNIPRDIVAISSIDSFVVDEPQHQILLWFTPTSPGAMFIGGVRSYNYKDNYWCRFHYSINKMVPFKCHGVVIVDNILLWHYYGSIFGYNLTNHQKLQLHQIDTSVLKTRFGTPTGIEANYPPEYRLVRAAEDKLVFAYMNAPSLLLGEEIVNEVHLYRLQIVASAENESFPFQLNIDGCRAFDSKECTAIMALFSLVSSMFLCIFRYCISKRGTWTCKKIVIMT